jgi:hypothetical protein
MNMRQLLILLAGSVLALAMSNCSGEEEPYVMQNPYVHIPPALPDSVFGLLRPGDIIIRKGNGPLSAHLMNNTKEEYTHSGVIVNEEGTWKVIHTIGGTSSEESIDGMQTQLLTEFVKHAADSMLFICRPIFADSIEILVPKYAYEYLDQKIPFDHRFSMYSTDKIYCTELLYYIFKRVNDGENVFVVKKQHKSYMLMFSTFFDEENFQPIFHLRDDNRKLNGYTPADSLSM